ncbi:DUF3080 family protein [Pseudoalteromonas sp. SSDWG2]|uniref:DUF3080 family protein n=1 Tax=Pseudoalteromonas sp. SSDWG2 TaxID=3139391 RepID=UPI003BAD4729
MQKLLFIFSVLLMLVGCSEQPTDIHKEYRSRLAKFLEIEESYDVTLSPLDNFATIPIESNITIGLIELGQLNHCRLSAHIAAHNNQLGKVALPSERFKYHIRFIQLVDACIEHPQTKQLNQSLIDTLTLAKQNKIAHAHVAFNNMMAGEAEFKRMTQLSTKELNIDEYAGKTQSLEALRAFANIADDIAKKRWHNIDVTVITPSLESLSNNDYIRKLITSARVQIALNRHLTQQLNTVNIIQTVCPPKRSTDTATILHNIFNMFYINQLQGYQAQLSGALQDLNPELKRVWQFLNENDGPKSEVIGVGKEAQLLSNLKTASKQHVIWWQNFYKQCAISPV